MNRIEIQKHYRDLVQQHGDTVEAAQYSSRESQEKRFEVLCEIADLNNSKILDFGCGTGHLASYLKVLGVSVDYTGVDIVEEFFDYGRQKHPEHRFGKMEDFDDEQFDYAFVSGVFNNKMSRNKEFYQQVLKQLYSRVTKGIAFNMMSKYVDFEDESLFYAYPEEVFTFVKSNLSQYVCLRNDYQVKPGVLPFEFAVYVYKH